MIFWYVWKLIGSRTVYFVETGNYWTFNRAVRTEYESFEQAKLRALREDATLSAFTRFQDVGD